MAPPLEHDYIGLSDRSDKLSSSSSSSSADAASGGPDDKHGAGAPPALNLMATELRLGLPGSESPDRMDGAGLTLALPKSSASGAKRGFSDAISGSPGKWVCTGGTGSEVESGKAGGQRSGPAGAGKDVDGAGKAAGTGRGGTAPAAKAQVVGWPPIRSYRKNTMAANPSKNKEDAEGRSYRKNTMAANPSNNKEDTEGKQGSECMYVKVSMDGAPYLRKVGLKTYSNYQELSLALEKKFSCFTIGQCGSHGLGRDGLSESRLVDLLHGSECVLTYEDKDGDWMLVGDVPWDMFTGTCRRLRIMKGSDAIGIAPRAMEKSKNRN